MGRLLIAAGHKSSGKTSVGIGLAAALAARGLVVQPFKKGPDYIDPIWLSRAAGRACRNLDFYTMGDAEIRREFARFDTPAAVSLIEGSKGLYDGLDVEGRDSNAALATLLSAPVILVIDTRGMARGIAPLVSGYRSFDPSVAIEGVILNKVGGPRHEGKLRAALERYTDVPVIGAIRRNPELEIPERHLGLMPANEDADADIKVTRLARAVSEQVDLDRILDIAMGAGRAPGAPPKQVSVGTSSADIRIAIARDAVFGFYYPDDLDAFTAAGVQLVPFDTLADERLPDADGLFIGGGFPETRMAELSRNTALMRSIANALRAGMPAYAECGGAMYLSRRLTWRGDTHPMVGIIPGDSVMHERPQGRGYMQIAETEAALWPLHPEGAREEARSVAAHEFHYASLDNLPASMSYAYRVRRGFGIDGRRDGLVIGNLTASFMHLRNVDANPWVGRFVQFVRGVKSSLS